MYKFTKSCRFCTDKKKKPLCRDSFFFRDLYVYRQCRHKKLFCCAVYSRAAADAFDLFFITVRIANSVMRAEANVNSQFCVKPATR